MPVIKTIKSDTRKQKEDKSLKEQPQEVKSLKDYPRIEINGIFLRIIAPNTYLIENNCF